MTKRDPKFGAEKAPGGKPPAPSRAPRRTQKAASDTPAAADPNGPSRRRSPASAVTPSPTGQARATGGTSASVPTEPAASAAPRDLVLVGDRISESGGYRVLRQREDRLEVGEMRALQHGQPITGEIVRLEPTTTHERVFACETLHDSDPVRERARSAGPAQVATATYRKNWEQIFGSLAAQLDAARDDDPDTAPKSVPPDPSDLN